MSRIGSRHGLGLELNVECFGYNSTTSTINWDWHGEGKATRLVLGSRLHKAHNDHEITQLGLDFVLRKQYHGIQPRPRSKWRGESALNVRSTLYGVVGLLGRE